MCRRVFSQTTRSTREREPTHRASRGHRPCCSSRAAQLPPVARGGEQALHRQVERIGIRRLGRARVKPLRVARTAIALLEEEVGNSPERSQALRRAGRSAAASSSPRAPSWGPMPGTRSRVYWGAVAVLAGLRATSLVTWVRVGVRSEPAPGGQWVHCDRTAWSPGGQWAHCDRASTRFSDEEASAGRATTARDRRPRSRAGAGQGPPRWIRTEDLQELWSKGRAL